MTTELLHVYKGIIDINVGLSSSGAGFYLEQDVPICFFFSSTELFSNQQVSSHSSLAKYLSSLLVCNIFYGGNKFMYSMSLYLL